jgi:hypothetical protein
VRPYQVATAAAIALIAAVAMNDSLAAFNPHPGTAPGDVGARWYPFWAATLMGVAAVFVGYRALVTPQGAEGVFAGWSSIAAVLKIAVPMLLYATLIGGIGWRTAVTQYTIIPPLGFYIATGLYMGGFSWWIGRYKIWWVALILIGVPLVIFLAFEIGFRVALPKSWLYREGILPF